MIAQRGFSLIELAVAMALTMAVLAGVSAMLLPAHGAFETTLEIADMQQRLRVAADTLTRDLRVVGAGAYAAGRLGPLVGYFPPVLPFRQGSSGDDAIATFRTDTISLITVPSTAAQTTLAADLLPGVLTLQAAAVPGCPAGTNLCGFAAGMTLAIYDETGNVDTFTVAAVADAAAQLTLEARPSDSSSTMYPRGSNVVEARIDVYYLKADAALQSYRLMHYDGSANADVPAVDHVVGLAFEYFGEPHPPLLLAPGRTSYGPVPPPAGTRTTGYPAGENCAFRVDADSGEQVPRLEALDAAAGALVPLTKDRLVDGPWCPDDANANRWDADLLRIRKVGVTIRVETALAALRGPAGVLFANGGSSTAANRWAPDQAIRFEVSPRNLNVERE